MKKIMNLPKDIWKLGENTIVNSVKKINLPEKWTHFETDEPISKKKICYVEGFERYKL